MSSDSLPKYLNRHQLAGVADVAHSKITMAIFAGVITPDALDGNRNPLFSESRLAELTSILHAPNIFKV